MNLRLRVLSGVFLAVLSLAMVWLGSPLFAGFLAVTVVVAGREYSALLRRLGFPPLEWLLYPLTVWFLLRFQLPGRWQPLELGMAVAVVVGLPICLLFRLGFLRWAASVAGAVYLGVSLGYFLALIDRRPADAHYGSRLVTVTMLALTACDIAAYFVGSAWGRHRFFPAISPKKSAEGAAAGVAGSVVVSGVLSPLFIGVSAGTALALGLLIAVVAQAGDLAESALKREAQVKDSGVLIPGHGGLLDRIDSVLFMGPAVYWFLETFAIR